ncbi:MAG: exodeoxyribonuclease VII small subunit [Deltaproteobacteria bacterium]|nr:exodeoxyribonuclease VII small subunit [Candidatus Zymogenaceae bacterium]
MSNIDFDDGLKKLEEIVERLDRGELTLEESLSIFEEGIKLTRTLTRHIEEAEKKIEILTSSENGHITLDGFDADDSGS